MSGASNYDFSERCRVIEQCLPDSDFRVMVECLHREMLDELGKWRSISEAYAVLETMDFKRRCRWLRLCLDEKQDGGENE